MAEVIRKFGKITKKTGGKSKKSGSYQKNQETGPKKWGEIIRNGGNEQNNCGK